MSSDEPEKPHDEIIIVRRGGQDEGEHHGGAWEVAYADFMTSMMAFFLVMWLINAANEETKAAVASYFNPIKLVDRRTNPKGIQENDAVGDNDKKSGNEAHGEPGSKEGGDKQSSAEQQKMMSEPYEELDKIAQKSAVDQESESGAGGNAEGGSQKGASEGTAYRDPFSPDYWTKNASHEIAETDGGPSQNSGGRDAKLPSQPGVAIPEHASETATPGNEGKPVQAAEQSAQQQNAMAGEEKKAENALNNEAEKAGEQTPQSEKEKQTGAAAGTSAQTIEQQISVTKAETPQEAAKDKSLPAVVREISSELSKLIKDAKSTQQPMVRVVSVKDGVAIELMDQAHYGMFSVGSAKPDKKVVDLLAGVAKILQNKKGDVVIAGHTDSRPYKSATYDNWQLSSSRAQMAYYMLVRGGLDEKRILRVEGYADHQLKNKADPYAAENRRIEIFMRLPQGETEEKSSNGNKENAADKAKAGGETKVEKKQ
ncbi:Motility protein B-like [Bartonella apis]|uniref:MotB family protein n=1 Tax=Bartonella apis TaxID=1686310 RepID=UPI003997AEC0